MAKFTVGVKEVQVVYYEVEADRKFDAVHVTAMGRGREVRRIRSHRYTKGTWLVRRGWDRKEGLPGMPL